MRKVLSGSVYVLCYTCPTWETAFRICLSFLRWTRPTGCSSPDATFSDAPCQLAHPEGRPEELLAHMGLLEVEAAADVAAAAVAARVGCKDQCVPCTLFRCIDSPSKGFVTEGQAFCLCTLNQRMGAWVSAQRLVNGGGKLRLPRTEQHSVCESLDATSTGFLPWLLFS